MASSTPSAVAEAIVSNFPAGANADGDSVSQHSVELTGYLNNDEKELAHYDTLPLRSVQQHYTLKHQAVCLLLHLSTLEPAHYALLLDAACCTEFAPVPRLGSWTSKRYLRADALPPLVAHCLLARLFFCFLAS